MSNSKALEVSPKVKYSDLDYIFVLDREPSSWSRRPPRQITNRSTKKHCPYTSKHSNNSFMH